MFKRLLEKGMISIMCGLLAFSQPLSIIAYAEDIEISEEDDSEKDIDKVTEEDNLLDKEEQTSNDISMVNGDESNTLDDESVENVYEKNLDSSDSDDIEISIEDEFILDESTDEKDVIEDSKSEVKGDLINANVENSVLNVDVEIESQEGNFIIGEDGNIYTSKGVIINLSGDICDSSYDIREVKLNVLIDGKYKIYTCDRIDDNFTYTIDIYKNQKYEIKLLSVEVVDSKNKKYAINTTGEYINVPIICSYDYFKDYLNIDAMYCNYDFNYTYQSSPFGKLNIKNDDTDMYSEAEIEKDTAGNVTVVACGEDNVVLKYKLIYSFYSYFFGGEFTEEKLIIIDKKKPEVSLELLDDKDNVISGYEGGYSSSISKGKVTVKEDYLAESSDRIQIIIKRDGEEYMPDLSMNKSDFENGEYVLYFDLSADGEYKITINCKDKANNTTTFESEKFIVDKTKPCVDITFSNNDAKNGHYYNADRTATIKVTERNFDANKCTLEVSSKYGNSVSLGDWSKTGDVYTCNVTFTGDDEYMASFSCFDKASNESDKVEIEKFVVDKTAPKLGYSFDNTAAHKSNYYNSSRTAKITINDISFDSSLVSVENNSDLGISTSKWSGNSDSYSAEIACTSDGKYQFYVYAEDLAGNKSEKLDCGTFIIDTTVPVIEITGVMDKSANSGTIIPVINCKDTNLDNDESIVEISGYKNGKVSPSNTIQTNGSEKNVTYNIFSFERVSDDIYTITATAEDMAGNTAEISYMFSVNRYGSTFGVGKSTADLVGKYYTNAEQDLVLLETNVDNIEEQDLYVTKNGKNLKLVKDVDYFIEKEGNDATWKAYTYTIKKHNFIDEGTYEVSLFTRDKAGNKSDSNAQGVSVKFVVDKTAPSIVVSGIEDRTSYESAQLDINIDIQDNTEMDYAEILIDGVSVRKYSSIDLEELVSYSINEYEKPITVTVRAIDVVGNLSEKKFEKVVVSTMVNKESTTIDDESIPLSDVSQNLNIADNSKDANLDSVLLGDGQSVEKVTNQVDILFYSALIVVSAISLMGGATIVIRRRKK